jgi:hypothetical protein
MELQNVPDVLVLGRKRKATDYEYTSLRSTSWQESAEAELYEQKEGENAALQRLLDEHKRSVEELRK